jgi:hypothetical protein
MLLHLYGYAWFDVSFALPKSWQAQPMWRSIFFGSMRYWQDFLPKFDKAWNLQQTNIHSQNLEIIGIAGMLAWQFGSSDQAGPT